MLVGIVVVVIAAGCTSAPDPLAAVREAEPSPELSPREVVEIQLRAFGNNNAENEGIAIAYRFASPSNRMSTGPLPRFTAMVQGPQYRIMLEHDRAEFLDVVMREGVAFQRVVLHRGSEQTVFDFVLQRQDTAEYADCWMTEAVFLRGSREQPNDMTV